MLLLGGAAIAWPLSARAQQPERVRRIGVLFSTVRDDPVTQALHRAFLEAFQKLGWAEDRNVRIDLRWGEGSPDKLAKHAAELASLIPDAILVIGGGVEQVLKATRTVPIVFAIALDPVGSGFVASLSRPGGNATGFMQLEYSLCGKWLELLKQIAPEMKRVAVLRDPAVTGGIGQFAVIQSVAPSLGIEVSPINLRDAGDIERGVGTFARSPNGGLILTASALGSLNRDLIIALAARYRLPTMYANRSFAAGAGLISYGSDFLEQLRGAAGYIDRILKGEKPADMPVQAPTKYELVINLKTASALGLTVPLSLLVSADEVIE